ncbi:hepatic and glial cell adhesion molecule-like isoform X1 [Scyliorhinus torazame]|uniref:hepatic and glial cell adhesion molecule-like isoform X1 n=1 Tax=Scyliorhinus torazame TaxID=75743 RepID=UPI003B5BB198
MQLFVFCLFIVCGEALNVRTDTINNAIAGEQALFPIQHQGTDQYDVTFRSKSPVAFKIFTWKSNNPEELHIVHPLYKHRVVIDGGFVMLNDVQVDDNGEYEINIDYYGTELKNRDESTFRMQVFEPVSQPETAILGNCKSSSNITLNCFVSNGTNVMMHWEKLSLFGVLNETYDGTLLVIDCVTEEEQYVYRCIAENPVSNATSDPLTVSLYNGANPKGKIHRLMFLVPLVMAVLAVPVPIILYLLWSTFFKGSTIEFFQIQSVRWLPGRLHLDLPRELATSSRMACSIGGTSYTHVPADALPPLACCSSPSQCQPTTDEDRAAVLQKFNDLLRASRQCA